MASPGAIERPNKTIVVNFEKKDKKRRQYLNKEAD
jgi:hypothetical protein